MKHEIEVGTAGQASSTHVNQHEISGAEGATVFDMEGTLARYGGSKELLSDMIAFFLEDSPQLVQDLKSAARQGDAAEIRSRAHALKGLLAGCGGKRAANAAQRVENAGEAGNLTRIDELVAALDIQIEILRQATSEFCA